MSVDDGVPSWVHGPHRPAGGKHSQAQAHHNEQGDEENGCKIVRPILDKGVDSNGHIDSLLLWPIHTLEILAIINESLHADWDKSSNVCSKDDVRRETVNTALCILRYVL